MIASSRPESSGDYDRMFEPGTGVGASSVAEILDLPKNTKSLVVSGLTDQKLAAIAGRFPDLRHLITGGSSEVTDAGLTSLPSLNQLESLDLEWSAITDAGLDVVAGLASLKWVDISFTGVTRDGADQLGRVRPDLEIEWSGEGSDE